MPPFRLRNMIGRLALAIALVIAIVPPLSYAIVRYLDDAGALAFKAELNAGPIAKFIYSHASLWQYQTLYINELIALPSNEQVHQQIFDDKGRLVAEQGQAPGALNLHQHAPIEVAGQVKGELIASVSLVPMLTEIMLVNVSSLALALLSYLIIRLLPLRALDSALHLLSVQNARFEAALDNMVQGLCVGCTTNAVAGNLPKVGSRTCFGPMVQRSRSGPLRSPLHRPTAPRWEHSPVTYPTVAPSPSPNR